MDSRILDQLKIARSLELLQTPGIDLQAFALLDEHWQVVWSHTAEVDAEVHALITGFARDFQLDPDPYARMRRALDNEHVGLCQCQADEQGQLAFSILIVAEEASEEQMRLIDLVCAQLEHEYQLNAELEFMATELGERYDELNMMFQVEGENSPVMFGYESLVKLVRDTSASLNITLTGLLIPSKRIEHFESLHGDEEPMLPGLQRFLRTRALSLVQDGQSIVINSPSDQSRYGLLSPLRGKLMISPLRGGSSHVLGLLVGMNDLSGGDFTNSDRKLMEVMASRIDRVLQVNFDPLTGLENSQSYEWGIARALSAVRAGENQAALLSIDIDRFSVINDVSGREAGDALISRLTDLLIREVGDSDTVARIGADKFGVLLEGCALQEALALAEKLRREIATLELSWGRMQHVVSACIGVAALDENSHTVAEALTMVELATKAAKEKGANRVQLYQETDRELVGRREEHKWVGHILDAIREGRLVLHAQLIQPLNENHQLPHYEILVRMLGTDGEVMPPAKFIPAAEHYRLMPELDWWVVEHALAELGQVHRESGVLGGMFSINLSGQSLTDERLQEKLFAALAGIGELANQVVFEITESAAIRNRREAQVFMQKVRAYGCRFSLDDFGSGLSSFAYLQQFEVDYLKIDGSFVSKIANDPVSSAMVGAINQVGQVMGLATIAEYVENAAIADQLRLLGVDFAQGYHYARPRPLAEILGELSAKRQVING